MAGPHDVPHHDPPTWGLPASVICKAPSGQPSEVKDTNLPNVKLSNVSWNRKRIFRVRRPDLNISSNAAAPAQRRTPSYLRRDTGAAFLLFLFFATSGLARVVFLLTARRTRSMELSNTQPVAAGGDAPPISPTFDSFYRKQ
jgi:hypothetical protein